MNHMAKLVVVSSGLHKCTKMDYNSTKKYITIHEQILCSKSYFYYDWKKIYRPYCSRCGRRFLVKMFVLELKHSHFQVSPLSRTQMLHRSDVFTSLLNFTVLQKGPISTKKKVRREHVFCLSE